MEKLTVEIDLVKMVDDQVERTINNFIHKEKETFGYWTHDLKQVVQEKLAEKFVNTYCDKIFANIAKDETLTILIREKVIANMAKALQR